MATNNAVNSPLSGTTGTGNFVGSTSPTLVTPALGTPSSGNLSNCTNLPASALPAGTMFNLQQATLTTPVTTTSNSFGDVTGLSVAITPTSSSNKVLVRAVVQVNISVANNEAFFQLLRGSTPIGVGTSVGSRTACGGYIGSPNNSSGDTLVMEWLDSPATTSSTTYKVQFASNVNGQTVSVNATVADTNSAGFPRMASTITVIEVHA